MSEFSEIIAQKLLSVKVNGETYTYRVVFEIDEDGRYIAECPAIEGCYTEGLTIDEAEEMMKDALKLSIESLILEGELIPRVEYDRNRPHRMKLGSNLINFSYTAQ